MRACGRSLKMTPHHDAGTHEILSFHEEVTEGKGYQESNQDISAVTQSLLKCNLLVINPHAFTWSLRSWETSSTLPLFSFLKILFVYFQREGKGRRKRGRETLIGCLQGTCLIKDRIHNPVMCLDWEPNWQPFTLQDDAQPTEPHQSAHFFIKKNKLW